MSVSTPAVSVVVPTFNRARLLPEALDSIFAQTCRPLEVLVVDDGSTDDTESVLQPYVARHGVRVLRQSNGGPSAARNRGMEAARGEYVAFLDSDDLWLPVKLAVQIPALDARPEAVMSYSNFLEFDPDTGSVRTHYRRREVRSGDLYRTLVCKKLHCAPPTVVVRRTTALRIGGFDEMLRLSEDRDFHIRMAREGAVLGTTEPLAIVRQHGVAHPKDPAVRLSSEAMRAAQERVLEKVLASDPSLARLRPRLRAIYHFGWGTGHLSRRESALARREFMRSIQYCPFQIHAYHGLTRTLFR
jgi:glycosyltransferase involved in cell wall biosynthesis